MRKIFFVLITVFFVVLIFSLVDVKEALNLMVTANLSFIVLATIIGIFQTYLAASRMKILVSIIAKVKISYFFWMGYLTSLISTILPFFVGGFSYSFLLSNKINSSYQKSFGIVLVDFSLGIVITSVLAAISIFYFGSKKLIRFSSISFDYLPLIALIFLLFLTLLAILAKRKVGLRIIIEKLKRGVALFARSGGILPKALLLTLPITFLYLLQFYLFFMTLGLKPDVIDFIFAASLFSILNLIPGAIAKIGQYETFGVLTLPYLLSLDKTKVFGVLLLQHAVSLVVVFVIGGVSLVLLRQELSKYWNLKSGIFNKLARKMKY